MSGLHRSISCSEHVLGLPTAASIPDIARGDVGHDRQLVDFTGTQSRTAFSPAVDLTGNGASKI